MTPRWITLALLMTIFVYTHHVTASNDASDSIDASTSDAPPSVPAAAGEFAWLGPFTQLARSLIRLPFFPSSSSAAVALIARFRGGPFGAAADWSHRFGRVFVGGWEARTFPNRLELLRARPWFRESTHRPEHGLEPQEESEEETDFEGDRPKLLRANILHVLAGRGFEEAIKEGPRDARRGTMKTERSWTHLAAMLLCARVYLQSSRS
jgi:hypothetical protein